MQALASGERKEKGNTSLAQVRGKGLKAFFTFSFPLKIY